MSQPEGFRLATPVTRKGAEAAQMEQLVYRPLRQRVIQACFALAAALLLAITVATFRQAERLTDANAWLMHTHLVIEASTHLETALNQADSGERGYLLTGDPAFLAIMNDGLVNASQALEQLVSLVRDNPVQLQRINRLQPLIQAHSQLVRQQVQLRRQQGFQTAAATFPQGTARKQLQQIRQELRSVNSVEQQLLQHRQGLWLERAHQVDAILLLGDLLSLSLLVWGFLLIQRQIRRREQAEQGRLAAEAARHDIEERLALMSDAVEDYAMILLDTEGRVIHWNPGAERIKGYTADEIVGRPISTFYPAEDRTAGKPQRALAIAAQTGKYREESWRLHKSGKRFWADVTLISLKDATGAPRGYAKITRDMTERQRHEEALRLAYERLEKRVQLRTEQLFQEKERALVTLHSIGDAVITTDAAGRVDYLNPVAESLTGWPQEEAKGQPIEAVVQTRYEHTRRPAPCPVMRALAEQAVVPLDAAVVLINRTGLEIPIEDSAAPIRNRDGHVIGCVLVFQDVTERRFAERALLASEKKFRETFEHSPLGMVQISMTGQFLLVNAALARMLGYTPEALMQQLPRDLVHPDDLAEEQKGAKKLIAGELEVFQREQRHIRQNGDICWANVALTLMRNDRGEPLHFVGTVEDITGRRQAQEALRRSEEQFRATFEHAPVGIGHVDQAGRWLLINPKLCEITGYPAQELLQRNVQDLPHPDDWRTERMQAQWLASGVINAYTIEARYLRRDSGFVWVETTVSRVEEPNGAGYFIRIIEDVTQRKQTEDVLRDNEAQLRATFEQGPMGITHMALDGRFLRVNTRFCALAGLDQETLMGLTRSDILEPEDADGDAAGFRRLLAGEAETFMAEYRILRKDAAIVWAEMSTALLREADGQPKYYISACEDVTERKMFEQALREAQENFQLLVEGATDYAMMMLNPDGRITTWNSGAEKILGYADEEIIGRPVAVLYGPEDIAAGIPAEELALAAREGRCSDDRWQVKKDGGRFFASGVTMPLHHGNGILRGFVKIFRDDTERRKTIEQTHYLANHDPLTGLPNRTYFNAQLAQALAYAGRTDTRIAILLLDLDRFKYINDALGHHMGDLLLQEVAVRLQATVRETDIVARLGGDEFVIIQTQLQQDTQAAHLAEKLVRELALPYWLDGQEVHCGSSIGITLYPTQARDPIELMKKADMAMYKAKAQGRHNYQFYTDDLQIHVHTRKSLEADLRRALEQHEFFLHYQPQISLLTWEMTGVEALLRWQNQQLQMLSPDAFISLAEETGLIVPIGEWVLRAACRQGQAWAAAGLPDFQIAVNMSARQLNDPGFHEMIGQVIADSGLAPERIELEITERLLLENSPGNSSILAALKEMGVQIAVDDFGTGFSALSYLKHFPVDVIKIDRSFTHHLPHNRHDAAIAASIIGLASNLGIRVVAEGVETVEQLAYLKQLDCSTAQGFYFSAPVTALELEARLRAGQWSRLNPT